VHASRARECKGCPGTFCKGCHEAEHKGRLEWATRQKKLYRALADSDRLSEFFDLAQDYFARGIERRLTESKRLSNLRLSQLPQRELGARASALAGSVLSLLRWWLDRGAKLTERTTRARPGSEPNAARAGSWCRLLHEPVRVPAGISPEK